MLGHALGRRWVRWTVPLALAAAVGTVLVATLASPNKASADVVIAGARSISEPVSIAYGVKKKGTTTDVHLLACNDFHGNLEAAGLNIYGQFAGGAAWLAKAVKDKQAQYGDKEIERHRRRQHRRQPACRRALLRGALDDRHQPHERRLRLGRQPRVRQGHDELLRIQNGGCRPASVAPPRPTPWPTAAPPNTYPGADFQYLSANVVRNDNGQDAVPGLRHQADQERQRQEVRDRHHRRGARGDADDRHADRRGRAHVRGRGRRRQRGRRSSSQAKGVEHQRARDPPGRLPVRHARP